MEILTSARVSKLDIINATAATPLKSVKGQTLPVKGVAVSGGVDRQTGEARKFAYIWTDDGNIFGSNSASVAESMESVADLMNEDESKNYSVTVNAQESKNGREFLTIRINER